MVAPGRKVIAAVSGGPDSMALMAILNELSSAMDFTVEVAHLDHGLRADSADDAEFVRLAAERLGLRVHLKADDVRGLARSAGISLEEAGRRCRYDFFENLRSAVGAETVATAHHIDDAIETLFLRIFRGSSLTGLGGIRAVRGYIIRPLIEARRTEIMAFLAASSIPFRTDPTNALSDTDRNFIRNELIPVVRRRFPHFEAPVKRTLEIVDQEGAFIEEQASALLDRALISGPSGLTLDAAVLRSADRSLASKALLLALYRVSGPDTRWTAGHVEAILKFCVAAGPSAGIDLPGGLLAFRRYEELCIEQPSTKAEVSGTGEVVVAGPGETAGGPSGMSLQFRVIAGPQEIPRGLDGRSLVWFDAEAARFPLLLRTIRPGDRIKPWGMEGTAKLKKILIDLKVPRPLRRELLVLTANGEILWIPGIRRSSLAPVHADTRRILEVSAHGGRKFGAE